MYRYIDGKYVVKKKKKVGKLGQAVYIYISIFFYDLSSFSIDYFLKYRYIFSIFTLGYSYWRHVSVLFLQVYCRILHVLLQFFMVANYMWMFCEGLHLHMALVVVFVNDVYAMRWFYAIGWALPAVLTTVYTFWRSYSDDTAQ